MEGHLEWEKVRAGVYRGWVRGRSPRVHPAASVFVGPDGVWYGRAWNGDHWQVYFGGTMRYAKFQANAIVPPP